MTEQEFEIKLRDLVNEANQEEIPIDTIHSILSHQTLVAETILRITIERVYKERFN